MDVKVSENCLSQPCSDDHLLTLSLDITKWKEVASFLRLSEVEKEEILCDNPTTKTRKIAMLRKWRQKFGRNATYGSLAAVFRELSRSDLAETVEALAASSGGCDLPVAAVSVKFDLDSFPNTSASCPCVTLLPNCCPNMVIFIFVLGLAVLLSHAITCTCGCALIRGTTDSESESELVKVSTPRGCPSSKDMDPQYLQEQLQKLNERLLLVEKANENSRSNLGPSDVPSSGSAPQPPVGRPEFENISPAVEEPESDSRAQQDAMMMKLMELNANLMELNNELLMQNTQLKKENQKLMQKAQMRNDQQSQPGMQNAQHTVTKINSTGETKKPSHDEKEKKTKCCMFCFGVFCLFVFCFCNALFCTAVYMD